MYDELDNRRTLDPWVEGKLEELRVRKADDEWLKGRTWGISREKRWDLGPRLGGREKYGEYRQIAL